MIIWNGMDIVDAVLAIVFVLIFLLIAFFGKIADKISKNRKKRNDRLWEKYGDKDDEDR